MLDFILKTLAVLPGFFVVFVYQISINLVKYDNDETIHAMVWPK
jgi:hypothetical protein